MLRIAKLKKTLAQYGRGQYGMISEVLSFVAIFASIVYVAHLLACFWYAVGQEVQHMSHAGCGGDITCAGMLDPTTGGRFTVGWVHREYCALDKDDANTPCTEEQMAKLSQLSLGERYTTSLYLVFNALEAGETGGERGFALVAELTVGLIFGALAGLFSAVMMTLRGNAAEVGNQLQGLNQWLHRKKIPEASHAPIMEYFHTTWTAQSRVDPAQLLAEMPPTMSCGVVTHLYGRE
eukprot:SAG22_NODE_1968_length_3235_cov_2.232143_2_plen_236_part_00